MHDGRTTLTQFIIEEQRRIKGASGDHEWQGQC